MMPFGEAFGEPVIIERDSPGGIDPETGDPRPDTPESPGGMPLEGCVITDLGGSESYQDNREVTTARRRLYAPYGSDIRAEDRVHRQETGEEFTVDGPPVHERSPFTGAEAYTVAVLELVTGPRT